jgi:adenine nucleotide transporter 17
MAGETVHAPPFAHAIGGALGSAFALFLFYPLERARIDLQANAATVVQPAAVTAISNKELESTEAHIQTRQQQQQQQQHQRRASPKSDENAMERSWDTESPSSSSSSSAVQQQKLPSSPKSTTRTTAENGLLECLVKLHARKALYQGVAPVVTTLATSQFIFFYIHALTKRMIMLRSFSTTTSSKSAATAPLLSLLAACFAGVANVLLTNPLWVCNIAIVTGKTQTSNLWKELRHMVQQYGLAHLWNGTFASLLLVSNPIIQFFCYEQFKQARLQQRQLLQLLTSSTTTSSSSNQGMLLYQSLSPAEAFCVGALAKGVATILTYPLQLAQTVLRLQQNGNNDDNNNNKEDQTTQQYRGTWDCLLKLYRRGGVEGLFTGMRAKLLQTVLTAAFTFLTYEQILSVVQAALTARARNTNNNA